MIRVAETDVAVALSSAADVAYGEGQWELTIKHVTTWRNENGKKEIRVQVEVGPCLKF